MTDQSSLDTRHNAAKRSTIVSIVVNIILSLIQLIAGIVAHSSALITDSIHSLSDLISDVIVMFASKHAKKSADDDHHFGHQRYETLASLFIGVLLAAVGLGLIYNAFLFIQHPEASQSLPLFALGIALATVVIKELLFRYMLKVATEIRSSMLIANAWHARSDSASSLVVAIAIAFSYFGFTYADPIAGIIVGFLIVRMGGKFIWDSLNDLADRAADEQTHNQILQSILSTPGLVGAHDLKTRKMGDMVLAEIHLEFPADMTIAQAHDIAMLARDNTIKANEQVLNIITHFDPV